MPNAPRKDGEEKISENADHKSVNFIKLFVLFFLPCFEQIFSHCDVYTVVIGHALKLVGTIQ